MRGGTVLHSTHARRNVTPRAALYPLPMPSPPPPACMAARSGRLWTQYACCSCGSWRLLATPGDASDLSLHPSWAIHPARGSDITSRTLLETPHRLARPSQRLPSHAPRDAIDYPTSTVSKQGTTLAIHPPDAIVITTIIKKLFGTLASWDAYTMITAALSLFTGVRRQGRAGSSGKSLGSLPRAHPANNCLFCAYELHVSSSVYHVLRAASALYTRVCLDSCWPRGQTTADQPAMSSTNRVLIQGAQP